MAKDRFSVEAVLRATDFKGRRVQFKDRRFGDSVRTLHVRLPAGKSAHQELTRSYFSPATFPRVEAIYVESDIEGVEFWPIQRYNAGQFTLSGVGFMNTIDLNPRVDPDTRQFGWLFPVNAPNFVHDHGQLSSAVVDHAGGAGTDKYHDDVLPTWQEYQEDRTQWEADSYYLSTFTEEVDVDIINPRVGRAGRCWDFSLKQAAGISGPTRTQMLLLGYQPGQYWNLGTHTDDLWFTFVYYVHNPTNVSATYPGLGVWSYPYHSNLQCYSDIPTTTPQSRTTWANNDLWLCNRTVDPVTGDNIGWEDTGASSLPHFSTNSSINFTHTTGWQARSAPKVPYVQFSQGSDTTQFGTGDLAWNRITMATLNLQGNLTQDAWIANVYFGPRPGRRHQLRPFFFLSSEDIATFWNMGVNDPRPTIGLQNPTDRDAIVKIILLSDEDLVDP